MLKKDALMRLFFLSSIFKVFLLFKISFMKRLITFVFIVFFATANAQLSNKHWLPPLHSRDDTAIEGHFLYLSTPETNPFQVTITTGDGAPITGSPFTLSYNSPVVVNVGVGQPTSMFLDVADVNIVKSDKGLILQGSKDFYVSFRMRAANHAETLISKGRPGIGTSFRLGSTPQGGEISLRNFVSSVMATEDNTTITLSDYNSNVTFVSGAGILNDDSQTFTLNAGQTIVFSGYADNVNNHSGFIGALLTATKPVAVNTGNAHGGVSNNGSDLTLDQIVSASQIGTEYIFIRGNGLDDMENPLIIANEDNTDVYVNGNTTPLQTLNAGDFLRIPASYYQGTNNKNIYVTASKPVFAYQLIGGAASYPTSGLNFIPPLSCFFQNSVNLPAVDAIGSTTYNSSLMILTYSSATLTVNGATISATQAQTVLGNTDWVTYRLNGYSGNVNVVSTGPLAVGVFGASGAAGYAGYYSGFGSAPQDTDVVVCSSATKNLFDEISGNPGTGGTWTVPAGGAPLNGNIFNPAVNIPGEYIYTFTKDCNASLVTLSVKVNVTVQPGNNPGISTTKNTCINESSFDLISLLGTNITPGGTWSPALASGTSIFNPAVDTSGIYTYTLPATAVCPELTASVTVTNNALPVINTITDLEECDTNADGDDTNGQTTFTLTNKTSEIIGSLSNIIVTYHISNTDATSNLNPITTYVGGNTTIYVRITNSITNCFNTSSFLAKVTQKPIVLNEVNLKQCDDDTDAISTFNLTEANSIIATGANLTFTYYALQADAISGTNAIANSTNYISANNGVVWARIVNDKGCFRTSKVNLLVSTTQVPSTFNITMNECDDYISATDPSDDGYDYFSFTNATSTILGLFPGNQNLTVTYYTSQANALAETNAITNLTNFRNTIPNLQVIWVRIDSNLFNDCVGLGPYITLKVNPLPNFDLPETMLVCVNPVTGTGSYSINATPQNPGNYSYVWTPTNPSLDAFGNQTAFFNAHQTGTYSVVVTNTATNCTRQDEIVITTSSPPVTVTAVLITPLFSSGLSSIQANATGGFGEYEYSLDGIDWQDSPIFTNLENGTYIVQVRDKEHCDIRFSNPIQTISYPNFFTPNGDSYNDFWNINGLTPNFEAKIYIYDRYGKLIKRLKPNEVGWDGTFNGQPLPSTDYWFKIEYKENNQFKEFKSHFSLKR
jgi:gliding motility-associated-like protein